MSTRKKVKKRFFFCLIICNPNPLVTAMQMGHWRQIFSKSKVYAHKKTGGWSVYRHDHCAQGGRGWIVNYRRPSGLLAMTRAGRVDPVGTHWLQTENICVCAPPEALMFASKSMQTFWSQIRLFQVVRRSQDIQKRKEQVSFLCVKIQNIYILYVGYTLSRPFVCGLVDSLN